MRYAAQQTDVYLLGLAVKHGGTRAMFDSGVLLAAMVGERREHLEVVAP